MILAIDPGLSGGWAHLTSEGDLVEAGDLPTAGDGSQNRIDGPAFAAIIDRLAPSIAIVEEVSAMPKQGVSSTFRFGRAVGALEGIVLGKGVRLVRVTPQKWKKHIGLLGKGDGAAEAARHKAIERWPAVSAEFFKLKKHHNRADAALIGVWFVETQRGTHA